MTAPIANRTPVYLEGMSLSERLKLNEDREVRLMSKLNEVLRTSEESRKSFEEDSKRFNESSISTSPSFAEIADRRDFIEIRKSISDECKSIKAVCKSIGDRFEEMHRPPNPIVFPEKKKGWFQTLLKTIFNWFASLFK